MSTASAEGRVMKYDSTALDNPYVTVSRDVAPCAQASAAFEERVILAMGDIELVSAGQKRKLGRGEFALFAAGDVDVVEIFAGGEEGSQVAVFFPGHVP